jgi:putative endonuclease
MSTAAIGRHGEQLAAEYLESQGFELLARNWRCARGEIDIVALDGDCLVICEVKTRRSTVCGDALEAVTPSKLARLHQLAGAWLARQERYFPDIRIDVIAVRQPVRGAEVLEHLRGVG